jgi:hypothetical protein
VFWVGNIDTQLLIIFRKFRLSDEEAVVGEEEELERFRLIVFGMKLASLK